MADGAEGHPCLPAWGASPSPPPLPPSFSSFVLNCHIQEEKRTQDAGLNLNSADCLRSRFNWASPFGGVFFSFLLHLATLNLSPAPPVLGRELELEPSQGLGTSPVSSKGWFPVEAV